MKPRETYPETEWNVDPYAPSIGHDHRFRFQEGPGILIRDNSQKSSFDMRQAWLNQCSMWGGTPLVQDISQSSAKELLEMLKQLGKSHTKIDPYLPVVGESLEERPGGIVIKVARQLREKGEQRQRSPWDEFLQPVTMLERKGHIDAALDVLYDRMDDLLKTKKFAAVDAFLQQAIIDSISVDVILGLLTASLPARSKLSARSKFYADSEASIKRRGAWEDGLLAGLES